MSTPAFPGPETIHRHQLPNGITLLIYENFASPSIVLEGTFAAGGIADDRALAGRADFMATMLLRGTAQRDFSIIFEALESVNANLSFSSDYHYGSFAANGLAEDLDLLLDLLADALIQPTFPEAHIERVRGEILTGLQMRENDTRARASLAFHELLYGDHPYANSLDGTPESIAAISREDLVDFHRRYVGPRGLILTVVGGVPAAEVLDRVQARLGHWARPDQAALPAAQPAPRPSELLRRDVIMPDKTQSDIVLGLPAPPRNAPDYLDLSLMNTILGVFGMMGRLGRRVREEQGLAYYVQSRLDGDFGPTPWTVSTGVAPDKVALAIESIRDEIGRIQTEPVPADELADSIAYRVGSLPVRLETNRGLAANIAAMELFDLGLDYLQTYHEKLAAITPERIQRAAQTYLSRDQLAIAVAGPQNGATP